MANLSELVPPDDVSRESIWRSPLVYVMLTVTAGIVLDGAADIPFAISLLAGAAFIAAFALSRLGGHVRLALVYLALAGVALAQPITSFARNCSTLTILANS